MSSPFVYPSSKMLISVDRREVPRKCYKCKQMVAVGEFCLVKNYSYIRRKNVFNYFHKQCCRVSYTFDVSRCPGFEKLSSEDKEELKVYFAQKQKDGEDTDEEECDGDGDASTNKKKRKRIIQIDTDDDEAEEDLAIQKDFMAQTELTNLLKEGEKILTELKELENPRSCSINNQNKESEEKSATKRITRKVELDTEKMQTCFAQVYCCNSCEASVAFYGSYFSPTPFKPSAEGWMSCTHCKEATCGKCISKHKREEHFCKACESIVLQFTKRQRTIQ